MSGSGPPPLQVLYELLQENAMGVEPQMATSEWIKNCVIPIVTSK